jgi:cytochrome b pre-mRNA-processing protein 3
MIALHAFLLMHRLKAEADAGSAPLAAELSQAVFDLMFADMDRNLREMGVTDLGVAPKIKKMVAAFYGRVQAYEAGLAAPDEAALADALRRNLFRGTEAGPEQVDAMAAYLRMQSAALARQPLAALLAGQIEFGAPAGES